MDVLDDGEKENETILWSRCRCGEGKNYQVLVKTNRTKMHVARLMKSLVTLARAFRWHFKSAPTRMHR